MPSKDPFMGKCRKDFLTARQDYLRDKHDLTPDKANKLLEKLASCLKLDDTTPFKFRAVQTYLEIILHYNDQIDPRFRKEPSELKESYIKLLNVAKESNQTNVTIRQINNRIDTLSKKCDSGDDYVSDRKLCRV